MAKLLGTGMKAVTMLKNKVGSVAVGYPVILGRNFGVKASASPAEKTSKPNGLTKLRPISPELKEFVGAPEISRAEATKVIWKHIKANNLQDPNDKKIIICDAKLKKIFGGKESIGFLQIAGLISPHLK